MPIDSVGGARRFCALARLEARWPRPLSHRTIDLRVKGTDATLYLGILRHTRVVGPLAAPISSPASNVMENGLATRRAGAPQSRAKGLGSIRRNRGTPEVDAEISNIFG
jgi:hypothetical protein